MPDVAEGDDGQAVQAALVDNHHSHHHAHHSQHHQHQQHQQQQQQLPSQNFLSRSPSRSDAVSLGNDQPDADADDLDNDRDHDDDTSRSASRAKRQRSSVACDECNKRKVRCDLKLLSAGPGNQPSCTNCSRAGLVCVSSRQPKKRGPRQGYIATLEERLNGLESLLRGRGSDQPASPAPASRPQRKQKRQSADQPSSPDSDGPPDSRRSHGSHGSQPLRDQPQLMSTSESSVNVQQQQPASGPSSSSKRRASQSLADPPRRQRSALSKTGSTSLSGDIGSLVISGIVSGPQVAEPEAEAASTASASATTPAAASTTGVSHALTHERPAALSSQALSSSPTSHIMPSAMQTRLLEHFFASLLPWYPYMPEPYFRDQIQRSPFLLNSILAMTLASAPPIVPPAESTRLAETVYGFACIALSSELERPTPMTVVALVLLFGFCAETDRGTAAWSFFGMAVRLALDLKLNKESPADSGESYFTRAVRRNVWWCCYISDRYCAAASGAPLLIRDEDCLVKLPQSDTDIENAFNDEMHRLGENASLQIGLMSSKDWYTPGIQNMGLRAYSLVLLKIFGKVLQYEASLRDPAHIPSDAEKEYRVACLSESLAAWFKSLPEYARDTASYQINSNLGEHVLPGTIHFMHLMYHCIIITLFLPRMTASIQATGALALETSPAFLKCLDSANTTATLISAMLAEDPTLNLMAPYASHCIYTAGIVHATTAKASTNPALTETALNNLRLHVHATQLMGRRLKTSSSRAELLVKQLRSVESLRHDALEI
ncbi:fungal-specific transcription factor domain-containing protein, partial [Entophlyctis helioformis]